MAGDDKKRVLVIAELQSDGRPSDATRSVATFAQRLSGCVSAEWDLFAAVNLPHADTSRVRALGARSLLCYPTATNCVGAPELLAPLLCQLVQAQAIDFVIAADSHFGKGLMPHLAALLNAAHVGDCTGLGQLGSALTFRRPVFAGVIAAYGVARSKVVTLTVRASDFPPAEPVQPPCPLVVLDAVSLPESRKSVVATPIDQRQRPTLQEARTIVCGGQPLGSKYFELLGPLAEVYGAALGATRALCDSGQVPTHFQVGQTGTVVAPDLYFAVGVSGSIQHLAGMRHSKTIVAINIDPRAPIFGYAHFGIVGDMWQIIPELVATTRKRLMRNGN